LIIPPALTLLILHVLEIAGRRLLLFGAAQEWLRTLSLPRWRWPSRNPAPAPATGSVAMSKPEQAASSSASVQPARTPKSKTSALERAKGKARDRMGR
jgi:hypothetical protein